MPCFLHTLCFASISSYSSGEWLSKLPNLNELILDHNAIEVFKDYPRSHSVETLWINNNNINELKMFLDTIIKTVRSASSYQNKLTLLYHLLNIIIYVIVALYS